MNYCLLLAGGSGLRMGGNLPKQFLTLNDTPIIIITLNRIINMNLFDKVIVVCNSSYIDLMNDLLNQYNINNVDVVAGGKTRLDSTLFGIKAISDKYGIKNNDVFCAHDSVRPFVSKRIIEENLIYASKHKAATTVVDLIETIVEKNENGLFKAYPRTNLFSGQSPQTFNVNYFLNMVGKIPFDIREKYTDLSEVIFYSGETVYPVMGDRNNIKITTPVDISIALELIKNENDI